MPKSPIQGSDLSIYHPNITVSPKRTYSLASKANTQKPALRKKSEQKHPLSSPPSVVSTQIKKGYYYLLGETIEQLESKTRTKFGLHYIIFSCSLLPYTFTLYIYIFSHPLLPGHHFHAPCSVHYLRSCSLIPCV